MNNIIILFQHFINYIKLSFILLFIIIFLPSCSNNIIGPKEVELNQEFELKINEQAQIKNSGLLITFRKVVEDSRCPEGADCLWQGNGKIELEIRGHDLAEVDSLNTYLEPKELSFRYNVYSYLIEMKELNPYPIIDKKINPEGYTIKLKVNKLELLTK